MRPPASQSGATDPSATFTYVAATLGFMVLAASGVAAWWVLRKKPLPDVTPTTTSASVVASASAEPSLHASASASALASVAPPPSVSAVADAAPPPTVAHPALPVEGKLPDGAAQKVIGDHNAQVRACYNEAVRRNPALEGTLVVRFVIGLDGAVKSVSDGGSTIHDPVFRSCVWDEIRTWRFPKPVGGDVIVDLPYRFETVKAP